MPDPLRLGLIGAGRWGQVYLKTITGDSRLRLTHLASRYPERAALLPYPVTVTPDWRQLLSAELDGVIIATPPDTHAEILETCVSAGKPVLVEKPLCLDLAIAKRLQKAVSASGVPVLVAHTLLFHPGYRALKAAIAESGEAVRAVISEGMALGPFRQKVSALWDWCPHDVSVCLDLLGGYPTSVSALGGPRSPGGDPEQVAIRLEFPKDVTAWIQAGRLSPEKRRSLICFTDRSMFTFQDGESVSVSAAPVAYAQRYTQEVSRDLQSRSIKPTSTDRPLAMLLDAFRSGLQGGSKERFGLELAVDVVRVLAECEASLQVAGG